MTHIEILSLILSTTGLIASIIFGISIFDLHKRTLEIKTKEEKISQLYNKLSITAVNSCSIEYPIYSDTGMQNIKINGKDLVAWTKYKYSCEDDLAAVNIIQNAGNSLIEDYIKEKELIKND